MGGRSRPGQEVGVPIDRGGGTKACGGTPVQQGGSQGPKWSLEGAAGPTGGRCGRASGEAGQGNWGLPGQSGP